MSRRIDMGLAMCVVVLCGAAAMQAPPTARAGAYQVRSCFADGIAGIWQRARTSDLADAYVECPEGTLNNHGLYARNVLSPTPAPGFASAQLFVNSPPGTYIDDIRFEANIAKSRNWQAGLWDAQNQRWLWCGVACGTSFVWSSQHVGDFATSSLALTMICGASQCASDGQLVAFLALRNVTLRLQDVSDPSVAIAGGSLAGGGWKRGVQTVEVEGGDNTGVQLLRALVDGARHDEQPVACDDHFLQPCPLAARRTLAVDLRDLSDGPHTLAVQALDIGSNWSSSSTTVLVDNSAPAAVEGLSTTAGEWSAANSFDLSWRNPVEAGAPIAGVSFQLCRDAAMPVGACTPVRDVHERGVAGLKSISVPAPGAWRLRLWLTDDAGNQNDQTARELTLRWDPEPPYVKLLDRDADDPARMTVTASDPVSGLAATELELRRVGDATWHSLAVERTEQGFSGVIDDELYPPGAYSVRARASDHAGNERSTETAAGAITLPLRLQTTLAVGRAKLVRGGSKRLRRILIRNPRSRFGETAKLTGRLMAPGGNPLADREIEVSEQLELAGAAASRIGSVQTDGAGRFSFKAPPGPNRRLLFRYAGTPTIRGCTGAVELRVDATSSIRVSRANVVNGDEVVFRGRVKGQPIPVGGKLLQLQVYSRGGWLTFATPRAGATGRWLQRYRFTATRGLTRYRFRVRLPREGGYPFDAGTSGIVHVDVTGL
jgi:hypothetical protein